MSRINILGEDGAELLESIRFVPAHDDVPPSFELVLCKTFGCAAVDGDFKCNEVIRGMSIYCKNDDFSIKKDQIKTFFTEAKHSMQEKLDEYEKEHNTKN